MAERFEDGVCNWSIQVGILAPVFLLLLCGMIDFNDLSNEFISEINLFNSIFKKAFYFLSDIHFIFNNSTSCCSNTCAVIYAHCGENSFTKVDIDLKIPAQQLACVCGGFSFSPDARIIPD